MFLEDYMDPGGELLIADHHLAQPVIFASPIFQVALTYGALKQ